MQPQVSSAGAVGAKGAAEGQSSEFLTFRLGGESYGIEILKVQEIRGYEAPTAIANAPAFIKGVINLRGAIVPVVDLRIKFGLGKAEYDALTVMMILNVADRVVGVVVDGVSDVISLDETELRLPPDFGASVDTRYLEGLATVDDRMLIIVNIERLLTSEEMALFNRDAQKAAA
jgi:purine-binding chemotaxis protein CheW